jgi:hypothetical protein
MLIERLKLAMVVSVPLVMIGTAAAQKPDVDDTYGGTTYGGPTYGGATYGAALPAPAEPVATTPPETTAPTPTPTPLPPERTPIIEEPYQETREATFIDRWGAAMALGGGVDSFVNMDSTNTDPGGGWNVRAVLGTETMFGAEASYIGSAQNIDAIGLDNDAVLVGNGAQGMLRFNMLPQSKVGVLLLGGLAWRHYDVTNESFNTSDVQDSDDVLEIPFGAGLQFDVGGMLVDARAEYRFTNYGDLMGADASSADAMDRWGVNANVGYRF